MKSIKEIDLKGKKVCIRTGLDLPIEDGVVTDDSRLVASLPTLEYLQKQETAITVIFNHFGRPDGKRINELSNKVIAKEIEKKTDLGIIVLDDLTQLKQIVNGGDADSSKLYMLENIRYWYQEESNEESFAKEIGELFDVYINDAFSVSHRAHASFVGFPKYTTEKCMGLLFKKELENLSKVKDEPMHPAIMVIGGAKIATKLPVIENMAKKYDHILVGGLIANEAIDKKMDLGEKVVLPVDYSPEDKQALRLDIGPKTVEKFEKLIREAKTIVWNGPVGKFEDKEAAEGTRKIHRAIAQNKEATQVVGGGETLDAINEFGNFNDFDYVSMSGGAMLQFLEGKQLPGLEALK